MALQPIAEDEEGESQGDSAYWWVDTKLNLSLGDLGTFLCGHPHMLEQASEAPAGNAFEGPRSGATYTQALARSSSCFSF